MTDNELVAWADGLRYDVVVFLGADALEELRFSRGPKDSRVLIAATASDEPDTAENALKSNLRSLQGHLGSTGVVVIRKHSIQELPATP